MALPTSGTLWMSAFHAEFGLGYSFNSYRGKGSVPTSGMIWFSQMYGASNIVTEGPIFSYQAPLSGFVEYGSKDSRIWWQGTHIGDFTRGLQSVKIGNWTYTKGALGQDAGNIGGRWYWVTRTGSY